MEQGDTIVAHSDTLEIAWDELCRSAAGETFHFAYFQQPPVDYSDIYYDKSWVNLEEPAVCSLSNYPKEINLEWDQFSDSEIYFRQNMLCDTRPNQPFSAKEVADLTARFIRDDSPNSQVNRFADSTWKRSNHAESHDIQLNSFRKRKNAPKADGKPRKSSKNAKKITKHRNTESKPPKQCDLTPDSSQEAAIDPEQLEEDKFYFPTGHDYNHRLKEKFMAGMHDEKDQNRTKPIFKITRESRPANKNKAITKNKRIISKCPHTSMKYYAKGMWKRWYHSHGREKKASTCSHSDKPLYAKGFCKQCYLSIYKQQVSFKSILKQKEQEGLPLLGKYSEEAQENNSESLDIPECMDMHN